MSLPLALDTKPMEARPVPALPEGERWRYEPKWDGFRCLAFRHGTALLRWRPDKAPAQCTFGQLPEAGDGALSLLE